MALGQVGLLTVALQKEEELGRQGVAPRIAIKGCQKGIAARVFAHQARAQAFRQDFGQAALAHADGAFHRDVARPVLWLHGHGSASCLPIASTISRAEVTACRVGRATHSPDFTRRETQAAKSSQAGETPKPTSRPSSTAT